MSYTPRIQKFKIEDGKPQTVIHTILDDGRTLDIVQPSFEGLVVTVKNALTDEEWAKHGSDSSNSKWQISEALKLFARKIRKNSKLRGSYTDEELAQMDRGVCPKNYCVHHLHHSGKDMVLQLVDRKEHQSNSHYGGNAIANSIWRERKINENSNGEQLSTINKVCNKVNHEIHKHDIATSCVVGVGSGVIFHYTIGKTIKSKVRRLLASSSFGIACGVLSNLVLNWSNNSSTKHVWV